MHGRIKFDRRLCSRVLAFTLISCKRQLVGQELADNRIHVIHARKFDPKPTSGVGVLEQRPLNCFASGRGVTRLDGARDKKQVWRRHVRNWGLSETNVLHWRKPLWHCLDFSALPAVIWLLHGDSTPGELRPRPLRYVPGQRATEVTALK